MKYPPCYQLLTKENSTSDSAKFPRVIGTAPSRVFGKTSPRVVEVGDRYNIGTPIIIKNMFNDIPYNGNVISANGRWYKIKVNMMIKKN